MAKINQCGIILCMILCDFIETTALTSLNDVGKWQISYQRSYFCAKIKRMCIRHVSKGIDKSSLWEDDTIRAAVNIIYLYTDKSPNLYAQVNALMRGDYKGDLSDIKMFQTYVDLLKLSHDLLCKRFKDRCKKYPVVYRGQTFIPSTISFPFTFESFVSTSKSLPEAQKFANGKIIFTIKDVQGLELKTFSAAPTEEEILIKPPLEIDIHIYLNSTSQKIMDRIKFHNGNLKNLPIPNVYVEGICREKYKIVWIQTDNFIN